jgi:hypothetical protein
MGIIKPLPQSKNCASPEELTTNYLALLRGPFKHWSFVELERIDHRPERCGEGCSVSFPELMRLQCLDFEPFS